MYFSIFTELCNHQHNLILEHFHHSKTDLVPLCHHSLLPPINTYPSPNSSQSVATFLSPRLATWGFGTLNYMAFCGGLLSSTYCIHLQFTQTVTLLHSFFVLLNNFPLLYGFIAFHLSIPQLMDI